MAAIALLRMEAYTNEGEYRAKAEATLELLAGAAGQYGLFAATYGIAAVYFAEPHEQIVIVGEDDTAAQLYDEAVTSSSCGRSVFRRSLFGRSVLRLNFSQAVEANLPPSLATTIPQLPGLEQGRTAAVVCSGRSCKPPVHSVEGLKELLNGKSSAA